LESFPPGFPYGGCCCRGWIVITAMPPFGIIMSITSFDNKPSSPVFVTSASRRGIDILKSFVNRWSEPNWAVLFSFIGYFLLTFIKGAPWNLSAHPYFNFLADAFIHGQVYLRSIPSSVHDISFFNGHYYLYWPPFPAIFLIPFVTLFGLHISDIFITLIIGSINVGLVAAILKAGNDGSLFRLSISRRSLLVMFFCFGTVQLTLAPRGNVWSTAQEIGFMLVALTYLVAIKLKGRFSFFLAGICIACALATRNHLIFTGLWPAWYLIKKHWTGDHKKMIGNCLIGLFPIVISGMLLIFYNVARFGDPLEVGISFHNMASIFSADYANYGAFNLHYVPTNLYYQYISYPFFNNIVSFFQGGSLFLLSPVFFAVFYADWHQRKDISIWLLNITILIVNIPILLLMGTGWVQFGPRYSLDFTVPLIILTAIGIQSWNRNFLKICFIISCIHYIAGFLILRVVAG
jgi:hypothetical protein